ncbi:enoyl-CoA hydratase [Peribacillus cavernae]|uniref:Enoyl-CoA hydratase n=1 Tax=Peribacillus cavernae TaxID=1674310 RepID=A0A3S0VA09_9BACI|nr:enoyl-CoA hydratase-related protein [Peribacillus cavernae]MDQ0219258.1 enoyl-CoA hydratase/carnithine racemase [Peribacillus cavernae]RUQ27844.1 enoyl-CoA hydratase [Peribacillus cavernae]
MTDLIFEVHEGVATITLNRPEARNAFSMQMIDLWIKALEEVRDNDEIRVLILTGNGRAFCAGGDIKAMKNGLGFLDLTGHEDKDLATSGLARKNSLWKYVQRIPLLMEEIDKPTIAAINGDAIGAGFDMSLQCDLRIASTQARFSEGYVNAGIVPGDGGGYYLPRLIGLDKALELLWTGRMIDSEEAGKLGLITKQVPHDVLMEEAYKLANQLARGPQTAIRLIKRTVYQGLKTDLRTSLDMVSSFMGIVTEHPDYQEGLDSIVEKRKPEFK